MKKLRLPLVVLAMVVLTMNSCMDDSCSRVVKYIKYTPVYMSVQELTDVKTMPSKALEEPGKIYFYNNYIFVNERNKGIHIIDNSDPAAPNNIAFINIPGNNDMAVQGNYLYADNGDDLITLDISNPTSATLVDRKTDAFPQLYQYDEGLLVYYDEEEVSEVVDCNDNGGRFTGWQENVLFATADAGTISNSSAMTSGVGGSMARFTISQGHLYTVDDAQLNVFEINSNPASPNELSDVSVGWGIETIFPYQDKLFIGSNAGMYIFDNSTPSNPIQLSRFEHARACDPVYVKDNYAYVTLRSGTWCEGFSNQLDLIDITDLTRPVLEETFSMDNPHGLSIKNNDLFLCEGDYGLKTFDISNPKRLHKNKLDHIKDIHAYDAINVPNTDVLLVIGKDGLYQYDASNSKKLTLLSKMEVIR